MRLLHFSPIVEDKVHVMFPIPRLQQCAQPQAALPQPRMSSHGQQSFLGRCACTRVGGGSPIVFPLLLPSSPFWVPCFAAFTPPPFPSHSTPTASREEMAASSSFLGTCSTLASPYFSSPLSKIFPEQAALSSSLISDPNLRQKMFLF